MNLNDLSAYTIEDVEKSRIIDDLLNPRVALQKKSNMDYAQCDELYIEDDFNLK